MTNIDLIFIDNHHMFLQGLTALISKTKYPTIKIVGTFKSVDDFLSQDDKQSQAYIIVMEFDGSNIDEVNAIKSIKAKKGEVKILVLSANEEYSNVRKAISAGADGYILKSSDYSELQNAVIEILEGKTYLGYKVFMTPPMSLFKAKLDGNNKVGNVHHRIKLKEKLTRREQEILRMIAQAKSNKDIATQLYISEQTVGVHRKNILRKYGITNTVTLIKYAIENELV